MHFRRVGVATLAILALSLPVSASPLLINGDLSPWGVTVADHNCSNLTTWATDVHLLGSQVDDQNDDAGHSGHLGPNTGGQDYDAEMMIVASQGNRYFITLATGQRPDNGFKCSAPGEIRLQTTAGTFAIEVGGGKGGASNAGTISQGAPGSTYALDSKGHTFGYASAPTAQVAGSIWRNPDRILDPVAPQGPTHHATVELSFDASLLGDAALQGLHWRPARSNEELDATTLPTPEPVTLLFLAGGTLLMFYNRRWGIRSGQPGRSRR